MKSKFYADLHVHTNCSDGLFSPEKAVETAIELGLGAIAITDHDCVKGIGPAVKTAEEKGDLEIVPGVEISAAIGDREIHILGYFIDWKNPQLVALLEKIEANRISRMEAIVEKLRGRGFEIDTDELRRSSPDGTIGRLHIARYLLDKGYVRSTNEAFNRYISDNGPCFVNHKRLEYTRAIEAINGSGGVAVLGHPGTTEVDEHIEELISAGIGGLEVYHSRHVDSHHRKYTEIVQKHSLVAVGGSDCHGGKKGSLLMGTVGVDRETVEKLRARSKRNLRLSENDNAGEQTK